MRDPESNNLRESPQGDQIARLRQREPLEGLGCLLFIVSSWVFLSALVFAASAVHRPGEDLGFSHEALVVFEHVPVSCLLVAWLSLFHIPIGKRLRLTRLRALRRAPAIIRHGILWAALILLCLLYCFMLR